MKPYLNEVNITNQELALWWINNISIVILMIFIVYALVSIGIKLMPRCAPASFEGKTVTNCIQK